MPTDPFYELYRKIASAKSQPAACHLNVIELAELFRDKNRASSPEESLAAASSCLHELSRAPAYFAIAISSWLTNDEDIGLAKALLHEASVNYLQAQAAKSYDLAAIDESRAILAACRLCALNPSPAISLGWALSLVVSYPASTAALNVAQELVQHHINEYPMTTRILLASQTSPFGSHDLAIRALTILEQEQDHLKQLPRLREFAMPPEMRLTFYSLKRNENRDIQRHSEKSSIFSQFVTKQHFKYAHKTAVEFVVGDEIQETSLAMASFQLAIELPQSELTDPISGVRIRSKLWRGLTG
ncbi:hypothetical protein EKG40_07980 [Pseudomonas moorei]|nr:hypothetical protein EKG40_07980 [Pseudomonas moorei]